MTKRASHVRFGSLIGIQFVPSEQKPPKAAKAKKQANIQLGVDLIALALRNISTSNRDYGRIVRTRYEIDPPHATACMQAARMYGDNDVIINRISWPALVALASPSVPPSVRKAFEVRIMAGERITAAEIRRARGRLKPGRPSKK
jgi:hypothetical protein